ncbi:hypothetical protein GGE15_003257 [Rhizobium esperanzae]|uniref:Uncharacterized protein n=1 Tax=Rhizobium esperanzae TaxID=1967781 RepID=A0A7W6UMI2_9HYPH|nr:hypothetical protein [Rhizobium esperanzae]
MMTAVEERTKPAPAMNATGLGRPKTIVPVKERQAVANDTCASPSPKM